MLLYRTSVDKSLIIIMHNVYIVQPITTRSRLYTCTWFDEVTNEILNNSCHIHRLIIIIIMRHCFSVYILIYQNTIITIASK